MNDTPNAIRVEIEFEDGEKQIATGEDAKKWVGWFNEGVSVAVAHGSSPPDVEFEEVPTWL